MLSFIYSDENNVNKHTTFCYVRKLFKDRSKSTKGKVMFLTSKKMSIVDVFINGGKFLIKIILAGICVNSTEAFFLDFVSLNPY